MDKKFYCFYTNTTIQISTVDVITCDNKNSEDKYYDIVTFDNKVTFNTNNDYSDDEGSCAAFNR